MHNNLDGSLITAEMFLSAVTDGKESISKTEELQRITTSYAMLEKAFKEYQDGRPRARSVERTVCNSLRGVLIRVMQAEQDETVKKKLREIFYLSFNMVGL